jgi:hypothetical protein
MAIVLIAGLGLAVLRNAIKTTPESAILSSRFALIGTIDWNRDGKDDRAELKRIMRDGSGTIDFDLPPPDVGKQTGTMSARINWYLVDDGALFRNSGSAHSEQFLTSWNASPRATARRQPSLTPSTAAGSSCGPPTRCATSFGTQPGRPSG